MKQMTVLYDAQCSLCRRARMWLERQQQFVRLVFVSAGQPEAQRMFPDLDHESTLAELTGTVKSFTEDWLAFTPAPPLIYGNITFSDGANVMMEFTDFAAGEVKVGMQVKMIFRIKDFDERRHFHRYFWKPTRLKKGEVIDG